LKKGLQFTKSGGGKTYLKRGENWIRKKRKNQREHRKTGKVVHVGGGVPKGSKKTPILFTRGGEKCSSNSKSKGVLVTKFGPIGHMQKKQREQKNFLRKKGRPKKWEQSSKETSSGWGKGSKKK